MAAVTAVRIEAGGRPPVGYLFAGVLAFDRMPCVMTGLARGRERLRLVLLDATVSSGIDSTAAEAFRAARDDLAGADIALWVVNAREGGWKVAVASQHAADSAIPPTFESLADAVSCCESGGEAATPAESDGTSRCLTPG